MTLRGFVRRHRIAIATNTALAVAAGAIVGYAISADGYRAHRTRLNDGGIWVTTSEHGYFGRVNKPIDTLDGVVYLEDDADLDVVQDGAAVVGVNQRSGRAVGLDPAGLAVTDGAAAALTDGADVQMAGGSLATVEPATGKVWGTRFDPDAGAPVVGGLDQSGDPLAGVGAQASLAVSTEGTVLVASAAKRRLATWHPDGLGWAKPTTSTLPADAGSPTGLTSVGEVPVTLDSVTGQLWSGAGAAVTLPPEGVLQQPGQPAASVLVATPGGLSELDLADGTTRTLVEGVSGRPAEPVRLGACLYAAWSGGSGYVATRCGDAEPVLSTLQGDATDLVFRVNHGEIVLNDRRSGAVWDLDTEQPRKIDNWEAFTSTRKVEDRDPEDDQQTQGDRRPPRAQPDQFGARAGRTSVLHPLDNDSAPQGRLLAIRGVDQPGLPGARVTISPDGQTLQLSLPADARGETSFEYYVDDGRSVAAHAKVTVSVRGALANRPPQLREGFEPVTWRVPAGGSIEVPVLPDWRDPADSDPLLLDSASVVQQGAGGSVARATGSGRIRFTAANEGGEVAVQYGVVDGLSDPVTKTLRFVVQEKYDQVAYPARAEPDVVSGEVGRPIVIRPLANDLPGSDPSTPHAQLALGGRVRDQAGVRVRTDQVSGVIRLDVERAGTYLLDYEAAYGNAPLAAGKIRVDARPRPRSPRSPVAMPDTVTLYGTSPGVVDVLANDVDPAGGILAVTGSRAERGGQLDVAVIDRRWLRISVRQGSLEPAQQVVRYTISNGASGAVSGEVLVSQRPEPADNTPVTAPDRAVVRAGEVLVHPVLDNDFSPSGDRLDLVADAVPDAVGQLAVRPPSDYRGDAGSAYAAGRVVRYVAPSGLKERESFTISYVSQNSTGETALGELTVIVVPEDGPNTAPQPPTLEGRMVAGDTLELRLPGTRVDPDGDPVTVTGIASPPTLGRVLSFGATSLEFQAYPGSVGTEEFEYTVTDTRGAEATGTIRVAVVPPAQPQPPVAVADSLTVAPGARVRLDVLANDYVAAAGNVQLELVDPPAGVSLESKIGPVVVTTPAQADQPGADRVEVVYKVSNGLASSLATATVRTVAGQNNPPVVQDAFGSVDDSDAVTVDLLAGDADRAAAFDPDGEDSELRVTQVYGDPAAYELEGNTVTVRLGPEPRVVPFRVEDGGGAAATASLYVPATGNARPYLRKAAMIELDRGASTKVQLADLIADPGGGSVELTGQNRVWSSPSTRLSARSTSQRALEVTARPGFRGPAAVLVEVVSKASDAADAADPEAGEQPTLISIPVQVGQDVPEITCPNAPLPVTQSARIEIDVPSVCQVWTQDPDDRFDLDYAVEWATPATGVSLTSDGGPRVEVAATGQAQAGAQARLTVRAGASEPATITVEVVRAPAPSLLPIMVPDMRPGSTREIDLARYLTPGVADPQPTLLGVQRLSGSSVQASASGSRLVLRAPQGAQGRTELRVEMSDVAGDPGPERRVTGRVSVEVLDAPSVPGAPVDVGRTDRAITLSWAPAEPRGAPIDHYQVREIGTGLTRQFRSNGGVFKVPANGKNYSFVVRAHNSVGYSDWSQRSRSAVADTTPGRVPWIRQQSRGDHTMTIEWGAPRTQTSRIVAYYVTWPGGTQEVTGDQRTLAIAGLDNNKTYVFSVRARNKADTSEPRISDPFQSLGTPSAPSSMQAADQQSGKDATAVQLSWAATAPEGPGPTTYTAFARVGTGAASPVPGCVRVPATSCRHLAVPYDGRTWHYTVQAYNQPGNTSAPSVPASFQAVGRPDPWGPWSWAATGQDGRIALNYTVPITRGAQSNVAVLVDGAVAASFTQATGTRGDVVTVPGNETNHTVQLRVCNEFASSGACTVSAAQQVQSYGPLAGHLTEVSPRVQGDTIYWVVSGSSNGNPAKLSITVEDDWGTVTDVVQLTGVGAFSHATASRRIGWDRQQNITVRLFDDDPGGRGEAQASRSQWTPRPPEPSLVLIRGACSSGTDPCTSWGVNFMTADFVADYTCRLWRRSPGPDQLLGVLGPYATNAARESGINVDQGAELRMECATLDVPPMQDVATDWYQW